MSNLYALFKQLNPDQPRYIATVTYSQDGQVFGQLPDGSFIQAIGSASIGTKVFIRDNVVEGPAPNLPSGIIDIGL